MTERNQVELAKVIRDCCAGKPSAQEELYKELYGLAMNIAMRYSRDEDDAANIVTTGFVKMFRSIKSFNASKGNFYGWFKKIIINEALDFLKVGQKFSRYEVIDDNVEPVTGLLQADQLSAAELLELIRMLPPTTQAVFNLYVIEGYTHKEIASITGISSGTSKWHLNKARQLLQNEIMNSNTR